MGSICTIIDHISPYVTFGKALGHIVANFRDYIISPYVTFGKALGHIVANLETTSSAHSVKLDKPVLAVLLTHMDDEQLRHSSITNMWVSIKQVIVISSIITRHNNTVRIMNGGLHADRLDNFFSIAACSSSCVLPCWGFMLSYKCISSFFEDNDGSS